MFSSPAPAATSARWWSPNCSTAGHQVTGLARSDASEAALRSAGAQVRRGALQDLDVLAAGAADADGVIHLAFIHDFADYAAAGAADLAAIEAIGSALADSGKPFVTTSGTAMLAFGFGGSAALGTEDSEVDPSGPRVASENATVALAGRGVRSRSSGSRRRSTARPTTAASCPPSSRTRVRRAALYIGDGANRWPAVHNLDAAHLYRLALEQAPADRGYTAPRSRASPSVRSHGRSVTSPAYPHSASPPSRRSTRSVSWARLRHWTIQRPAMSPARCSTGIPSTRGCSRICVRDATSTRPRLRPGRGRSRDIRRIPSRQSTVVPPTSSRIRSVGGAAAQGLRALLEHRYPCRPVSRCSAPLLQADLCSPHQLTVVAGTDAASSSFGSVAMMSSSWIGL